MFSFQRASYACLRLPQTLHDDGWQFKNNAVTLRAALILQTFTSSTSMPHRERIQFSFKW